MSRYSHNDFKWLKSNLNHDFLWDSEVNLNRILKILGKFHCFFNQISTLISRKLREFLHKFSRKNTSSPINKMNWNESVGAIFKRRGTIFLNEGITSRELLLNERTPPNEGTTPQREIYLNKCTTSKRELLNEGTTPKRGNHSSTSELLLNEGTTPQRENYS